MSNRLGLNAQLKPHLSMTSSLQQAIELLQLCNLDLDHWIGEHLSHNPFIEIIPPESQSHENIESDGSADDAYPSFDSPISSHQTSQSKNEPADFYWDQLPGNGPSLYDHILEQIHTDPCLNDQQKKLAELMATTLDPTGYWPHNLEETCQNWGCSSHELEYCLIQLQHYEPSGIFARNLRECLSLQLQDLQLWDDVWYHLMEHLEDIGKIHPSQIAKKISLTEQELQHRLQILRRLDPKPGLKFDPPTNPSIFPDLGVKQINHGHWQVYYHHRGISHIQLTPPATTINPAHLNPTLRQEWKQAKFIHKAIEQRKQTLIKVGQAIMDHQIHFLEYGVSLLSPLTLREIAEKTGYHESTISRVTNNKWIQTPRGTFELKFFFRSGIANAIGNKVHSSESIRFRIQKLIETEAKTIPLSDDKLAIILKDEGIDIARRTVAKYRESMHIPPSHERKHPVS